MYKIIMSMLCAALVAGCNSTKAPGPNPDPGPYNRDSDKKEMRENTKDLEELELSADKASEHLGTTASAITLAASSIKQDTAEARAITPDQVKAPLGKLYTDIDLKADAIVKDSKDLSTLALGLSQASGTLDQLGKNFDTFQMRVKEQDEVIVAKDKQIEALTNDVSKLKSDYMKALNERMVWLIVIGVLVIAAGIVLSITTSGKLMALAIGGAVTVVTCLAVMAMTKFEWLFGIIGAVGFAVIMCAVVWYVVDLIKHKKALEEVVKVAEIAKAHLPDDLKDKVFSASDSVANIVNSSSTKAIVEGIRTDLKVSGN